MSEDFIEANAGWHSERDLAMDKEALDVQQLFRFEVSMRDGPMYFCQEVEEQILGDGRSRLILTDCWARDLLLNSRLVPKITAVCADYDITELRVDQP